jgi:hypothetical protein
MSDIYRPPEPKVQTFSKVTADSSIGLYFFSLLESMPKLPLAIVMSFRSLPWLWELQPIVHNDGFYQH